MIPPSTWAFAVASVMALALLAVTGYEPLRMLSDGSRSDFDGFTIVDPAPSVLLMSALGVASRAMEVAAGRPSLSPRFESLALLLCGLGASAIVVLPVIQPLLGPADTFEPGLSTAATVVLLALGGLWLAAMLGGRERRLVPALWVAGAVVLWMLAITAHRRVGAHGLDRFLHDTYYVVAFQHWAIMVAVGFVWFAGWYALFTEITGRRYLPWLAALQAVVALAGTALTFGTQIMLGMMGMPRRYADYPNDFATLNFYSSIGSYVALSSVIPFFAVLLLSRRAADTADAGSARN